MRFGTPEFRRCPTHRMQDFVPKLTCQPFWVSLTSSPREDTGKIDVKPFQDITILDRWTVYIQARASTGWSIRIIKHGVPAYEHPTVLHATLRLLTTTWGHLQDFNLRRISLANDLVSVTSVVIPGFQPRIDSVWFYSA